MYDTYYGTPAATKDFLAHYGIAGMKWGIRKERAVNTSKHNRSQAYNKAMDKLRKTTSAGGAVGGAIGGAVGGLTKGMVGGLAGGALGSVAGSIAAGTASYLKNRKALKAGPGQQSNINKQKNNKVQNKPYKNKQSNKEKAAKFARDMQNNMGALKYGGAVGGAIGAAKYIKQHPKEYQDFKKRYKQMSFKDRMKVSYGRY